MLSKLRINNLCHTRWISGKVKFKLDEAVNQKIENNEMKARKHPGILYPGIVNIPDRLLNIIQHVLREVPVKTLLDDSSKFWRQLQGKHPPAEKHVYFQLYKKVQESHLGAALQAENLQDTEDALKKNHTKVMTYLKQKIHNSVTIDYDKDKTILYLLARGMSDYAVLTKIFYEIKQRDPTYIPRSIFDFGSGIGTVMWAACDMWNNKVQEYFGTDISEPMIEMSEEIIKKYRPDMTKLFFKQYFPSSLQPNYDMTVSAFSLMELPNAKERVNVLYKLWKKTNNYMVVVENGTKSGFNLINEARDFILFVAKKKETYVEAHVFSPCPHDLSCPKLAADSETPCSFETIFYKFPYFGKSVKAHELYSYVVFKKAPRQDEGWPRIVGPVLKRARHNWCDLCTSSGNLQHVVFTKSKHGKYLHRCVKASDWGDRIPVQEEQISQGTEEEQGETLISAHAGEPTSESGLA